MNDLETQMTALLNRANTTGVDDQLLDEYAELKQQQEDGRQQTAHRVTQTELAKMTTSQKIAAGLKASQPAGRSQNQRRK